jgi:hypothetical protein
LLLLLPLLPIDEPEEGDDDDEPAVSSVAVVDVGLWQTLTGVRDFGATDAWWTMGTGMVMMICLG